MVLEYGHGKLAYINKCVYLHHKLLLICMDVCIDVCICIGSKGQKGNIGLAGRSSSGSTQITGSPVYSALCPGCSQP